MPATALRPTGACRQSVSEVGVGMWKTYSLALSAVHTSAGPPVVVLLTVVAL